MTTLKKEYPFTPRITPEGQAVSITVSDFKADALAQLDGGVRNFLELMTNLGRNNRRAMVGVCCTVRKFWWGLDDAPDVVPRPCKKFKERHVFSSNFSVK
jgi:hypothetical protein